MTGKHWSTKKAPEGSSTSIYWYFAPPVMLRVPGSKVVYFREKILQVLQILAVFGLRVLLVTVSTRSISRLCSANTAILAVFGGSIL